jgi:hypothetical protein
VIGKQSQRGIEVSSIVIVESPTRASKTHRIPANPNPLLNVWLTQTFANSLTSPTAVSPLGSGAKSI